MFWIIVAYICTLMTFSFIRICINFINDDLWKIVNWANANGLCINPSKSKCLLLSRTKIAFDVPDIIIGGTKLILLNRHLIWVLSLVVD